MDTVSVSSVEVSLRQESNTSQPQVISLGIATVSLQPSALTVMGEATGKSLTEIQRTTLLPPHTEV